MVEMMSRHQVFWVKANNDRIQGKMALHDRLRYIEKDGKVLEYPGLIFIKEECPHAIRTIPALEYAKHRVEDVDTTAEDHAYDAIRYWCIARPWSLPEPKSRKDGWRDRLFNDDNNWATS